MQVGERHCVRSHDAITMLGQPGDGALHSPRDSRVGFEEQQCCAATEFIGIDGQPLQRIARFQEVGIGPVPTRTPSVRPGWRQRGDFGVDHA